MSEKFDKTISAITEDSIRRSLANIEAALEMRFGGATQETAWLIDRGFLEDTGRRLFDTPVVRLTQPCWDRLLATLQSGSRA